MASEIPISRSRTQHDHVHTRVRHRTRARVQHSTTQARTRVHIVRTLAHTLSHTTTTTTTTCVIASRIALCIIGVSSVVARSYGFVFRRPIASFECTLASTRRTRFGSAHLASAACPSVSRSVTPAPAHPLRPVSIVGGSRFPLCTFMSLRFQPWRTMPETVAVDLREFQSGTARAPAGSVTRTSCESGDCPSIFLPTTVWQRDSFLACRARPAELRSR